MKRIVKFYLLGLLCTCLLFLSGCEGPYVETKDKVWGYRVITEKMRPNNKELVGTIVVVRLLDPIAAADENGYVTIPLEIDGYKVTELGDIGDGIIGYEKYNMTFYTKPNAIERLIIPSKIKINERNFFKRLSAKYVEFLSDEPYIFIHDDNNYTTTYIVPNGVKETFLSSGNIIFRSTIELERVVIVEKWEIDGYQERN